MRFIFHGSPPSAEEMEIVKHELVGLQSLDSETKYNAFIGVVEFTEDMSGPGADYWKNPDEDMIHVQRHDSLEWEEWRPPRD